VLIVRNAIGPASFGIIYNLASILGLMSSSLWDSRFDLSSEIQNAIASVNIPEDDAFKISSILAAAGTLRRGYA